MLTPRPLNPNALEVRMEDPVTAAAPQPNNIPGYTAPPAATADYAALIQQARDTAAGTRSQGLQDAKAQALMTLGSGIASSARPGDVAQALSAAGTQAIEGRRESERLAGEDERYAQELTLKGQEATDTRSLVTHQGEQEYDQYSYEQRSTADRWAAEFDLKEREVTAAISDMAAGRSSRQRVADQKILGIAIQALPDDAMNDMFEAKKETILARIQKGQEATTAEQALAGSQAGQEVVRDLMSLGNRLLEEAEAGPKTQEEAEAGFKKANPDATPAQIAKAARDYLDSLSE